MNNNSSDRETARDHGTALLGLHLAQASALPQGDPPSDEELAMLVEGSLPRQRRQQVLSHLLSTPERYRQWLDLAAMTDKPTVKGRSALQILLNGIDNWVGNWRYAAGAIGAVAATALVAIYSGILPPLAPVEPQWERATLRDAPASEEAAPAAMEEMLSQEVRRRQPPLAQAPENFATAEPSATADTAAAAPTEREALALQAPAQDAKELKAAAKAAPASASPDAEPHCSNSGLLLESQRRGRFCLLARRDGVQYRGRWQWQPQQGESRALRDEVISGLPGALKLSPNGRWLAYRLVKDEEQRLQVRLVPGLFAEQTPTIHYLGLLSPVADFHWEDKLLHIHYAEGEAVRSQRFDPETGKFLP